MDHNKYFDRELTELRRCFGESNVLEFTSNWVAATDLWRLLLRNICRIFDTFTRNIDHQIPGRVVKGDRSLL